jgi:hypothetical protein
VWAIIEDYAPLVGVPATPHAFRYLKASTLLTTKQIYAQYAPQVLGAAVRRCSATAVELVAKLQAKQERRRE